MPTALILSSYVASSRVGGAMQALVLAGLGFDPILVPTVLFGRHPGWGAPGGGPVLDGMFDDLLGGVEANGAFGRADLIITGYFASAGQVRAAARAIDAIRAIAKPLVVVDPIMGDRGRGLYVQHEVADAVCGELIARADIVCPNAWELERLTGLAASSPDSAADAARRLGRPTLVSSVVRDAEIGAVYADASEAWFAAHASSAEAPRGTGDLLTALFAAALAEGRSPSYALARALGGVAQMVVKAAELGSPELPIAAMGGKLRAASSDVLIERLG